MGTWDLMDASPHRIYACEHFETHMTATAGEKIIKLRFKGIGMAISWDLCVYTCTYSRLDF